MSIESIKSTPSITSLFFGLILLFGVASADESAGPITLDLEKSGNEWTKERDEAFENQGVVEFSLANENPDNWSEVVTVQYFTGARIPPKELFDLFIEDLKKHSGEETIESKIIKDKGDDLFGEWSILGTPQDQHEWLRIISNGNTTAIIRYTTKNQSDLEGSRLVWEEILYDAHFTEEAQ